MAKVVHSEKVGNWEGRVEEDNLDNAGPSYWPSLSNDTTQNPSVSQDTSWASDQGYASLDEAKSALEDKIKEWNLR